VVGLHIIYSLDKENWTADQGSTTVWSRIVVSHTHGLFLNRKTIRVPPRVVGLIFYALDKAISFKIASLESGVLSGKKEYYYFLGFRTMERSRD
jgi:hypothetical protein